MRGLLARLYSSSLARLNRHTEVVYSEGPFITFCILQANKYIKVL